MRTSAQRALQHVESDCVTLRKNLRARVAARLSAIE
jgi:hypothetical protein